VLSGYFPGVIKDNHEKLRPERQVPRLRFETHTSKDTSEKLLGRQHVWCSGCWSALQQR